MQRDLHKSEKTQEAVTDGGSALRRYQDTIVGSRSFLTLLYFEWCMLVGALPGAAGLFFRKLFWPKMFSQCGTGTVFGSSVTLRRPRRIALGNHVVISDGTILDARSDEDLVIRIGDDTILSNNVMISCKQGTVDIGERVGVGAQTIIHSVNGCNVELGSDLLIGPQCYFAGGGNYRTDRTDMPMNRQGLRAAEKLSVADDVWFGARVAVMPEVTVGRGAIVGAGAVVTENLPEFSVSIGVPARVVGSRLQ